MATEYIDASGIGQGVTSLGKNVGFRDIGQSPRDPAQPPPPTLSGPSAPVPNQQPVRDYSGHIADQNGDSPHGPGTLLGGGTPAPSYQASYASPLEAAQWGLSGFEHGYYGTVQDAADANRAGNNPAATGALQSFIARGPTGKVETPGTLGIAINHLRGNTQDRTNINSALGSLSESGDLYSDDNSSGYFGDDLHTQQTVSDVDATSTYGDWSSWDDSHDNDSGSSVGDSGTAHDGGSSGVSFADDAAASDSGGGGGK